ncbi:MAG TPA: hypothetical protein VM096_06945 [Vicinamibacterales bacterium]|nr:hypothetical protein [Vicinamibacterales bacterium]
MKRLSRALALIICAVVTVAAVSVAAECLRAIVTESDIRRQAENTPPTNNWVLYTRTPIGTSSFVVGPANPPAGIGSFEMQTPTAADKVTLFNYDHVGTPLREITSLGYSTYRDPTSTANPVQVPSINIEVDYNGSAPGGFTTLVFEPVYNTDQGAVTPGVWQDWDAYNGGNAIWWSSRPIGGCLVGPCYQTWNQILANNPDAVIVGGFGVNQGSGNGGLTASTDALKIAYRDICVLYDLEPFRATNECKKGGWQTMSRADGSPFKNQGDCVSYMNTGK